MSCTCGGRQFLAAIMAVGLMALSARCAGFEVYFPMSAVRVKLPVNEKSQSIFSKIPIAHFQALSASDNTLAIDYIYSVEPNTLLRINSSSGEVFIRNDYRRPTHNSKYIITAIPKYSAALRSIAHASLEVQPLAEQDFCGDLENVCFWAGVQYTLVEDAAATAASDVEQPPFKHVEVGTINPRGSKYICPNELRYILERGSEYFALKDNKLYTKLPLDHDMLNVSEAGNLNIVVRCMVKTPNVTTSVTELKRSLRIKIIDRNDNAPKLQSNHTYNFNLLDPHFKMNESIGERIIFVDKDSLAANDVSYIVHNDTNELVQPVCSAYEADHTGPRSTVISCQITFARSGVLSERSYCFQLEAKDGHAGLRAKSSNYSAVANVCLHTNTDKIHRADRPQTMALLAQSKAAQESPPPSGEMKAHSILNAYAKDVYVSRRAMMYSRVTQPEPLLDFNRPELRRAPFALVEDRSNAFAITAVAGIVYIKDVAALQRSPETVYFLNISWQDTHARLNVHLVADEEAATAIGNGSQRCEYKVKSRSQTCAQIKYATQCGKFCGLGTNGSACAWRGSNDASFSRNYGSCVPNAQFCPDNVCDALEELNGHICPQDCTPGSRIMGPRSVNDNKRGIFSASGTCTCEDNGKCSCAPLDSEEPRPKRNRKNELRGELVERPSTAADQLNSDGAAPPQPRYMACGRSCLILAIVCPLVLALLVVCLLLARRNLRRSRLGKKSEAGGVGSADCDMANGDLPLMRLGKFASAADSKWEFDRAQLILDIVLGEGEFGKVMKGYATDIPSMPSGVTTVAVKMLKNGANSVEYMALLSEFQLLQEVSHPNVIRLLGACTQQSDAPMIIIEYARYGSLRGYLRLSRKIECAGVDYTDGVEPVTAKDVLSFAWQVSKGMAYLTEIKLVHRDLAARNVLLAEGKICKISDFGLTRDVYEDDAYLKRSRDRVPVKWMAPESLADHVYTTKSDVWAFGVLAWELITLGASPYPGVPPQNLYHLLKTGYRMERPEYCSEQVFAILRSCWTDDPNARPSFKYMADQFEKLLGNNAKYIELQTNAFSNPSYCSDEANSSAATLSDLTSLASRLGEPDSLDHLWHPPKSGYQSTDGVSSHDFSGTTLSTELQSVPPGYDMPRPLIEAATIEQALRYENDLRFPLNIRKSVGTASSITSNSQNGSRCVVALNGNCDYAMPVKRGRSYLDMTHMSLLPDNLDGKNFEKHLSKTISFRFASLLNLSEHDNGV